MVTCLFLMFLGLFLVSIIHHVRLRLHKEEMDRLHILLLKTQNPMVVIDGISIEEKEIFDNAMRSASRTIFNNAPESSGVCYFCGAGYNRMHKTTCKISDVVTASDCERPRDK